MAEIQPKVNVNCSVVVRNTAGKLLLLHLFKKPDRQWRFVGGKPEIGETLIATAARELNEEIGIHPLKLELVHEHINDIDGAQWHGYYFLCSRWLGRPAVQESEKCDAIYWMSAQEIEAADTPAPEKLIARKLTLKL